MFDNTLYEQLQQAMAEAEKETRRRQKAERDKIETVRRVIFFFSYLELLECLANFGLSFRHFQSYTTECNFFFPIVHN